MPAETSEYRGNPIIILKRSEDDRFPFSFGLSKARLIIQNIDDIKKFVEKHEPEGEEQEE